tara:strand:- start:293 stop:493 length:201 start_codon:yes stop_codon:yes gene_type:complete
LVEIPGLFEELFCLEKSYLGVRSASGGIFGDASIWLEPRYGEEVTVCFPFGSVRELVIEKAGPALE